MQRLRADMRCRANEGKKSKIKNNPPKSSGKSPPSVLKTLVPISFYSILSLPNAFSPPLFPLYCPKVKNNRSPTSPIPGTIMPFLSHPSSTPPSQISTLAPPSSAARRTPPWLPSTLSIMILSTPHSSRVWMAATAVPPVAMTGSRMMAKGCGVLGWWEGRLL